MVDGDDDGERMKKKVHSAMVAKHPSPTPPSEHVKISSPPPTDDFDMFSDSPTPLAAAAPSNPAAGPTAPNVSVGNDVKLSDNWDDTEGYYKTMPGDTLSGRYTVQSFLGQGVFASVVRASDMKGEFGSNLAIKVIRANDLMTRAAEKELAILRALNDPTSRNNIVRLLDTTVHRGHITMVFEGFSYNLREVLNKFGRNVGLSIDAVRSYSRQMLNALYWMGKKRVIHQVREKRGQRALLDYESLLSNACRCKRPALLTLLHSFPGSEARQHSSVRGLFTYQDLRPWIGALRGERKPCFALGPRSPMLIVENPSKRTCSHF